MRRYLKKILFTAIILPATGLSALYAQAITSDTTKLIATLAKSDLEYKSEIKEANVIFPDNLEGARLQSLDYVEQFSDKKRDFLLGTYETGKKYFPQIVEVLKLFKLPEELRVLIALESNFQGNAVSRAGAVGYWQLMDQVAKKYGLHIASSKGNTAGRTKKKDERKNLAKSTLAAAKYFNDQKSSVNNDLLLMVAAYNCGIGTLRSAIKRSRKTDPDFWDLKNLLPKETRNFVMNFIALNVIFNNYENFASKKLSFAPQVVSIPFPTREINNAIPVEQPEVQ